MMEKVAVFGILRFPPEKMDSLLPHLKEFIEATLEKDGCIAYDVAEDLFDKGLLRFSELWPDRESLCKHLTAPHLEPWRTQARIHGLLERKFESYNITSSSISI